MPREWEQLLLRWEPPKVVPGLRFVLHAWLGRVVLQGCWCDVLLGEEVLLGWDGVLR